MLKKAQIYPTEWLKLISIQSDSIPNLKLNGEQ